MTTWLRFIKTNWVSAALIFFLVFVPAARALNPDLQITQYAHTAWRIQDGSFATEPSTFSQTPDGQVRFGTTTGMLRFDGVRFTPWTPAGGDKLPTAYIQSQMVDRDGSLWIGTGGGIAHLVHGRLTSYPMVQGVVESIVQDHNGHIWFVRAMLSPGDHEGPLCEIQGLGVKCFGAAEGVPLRYAASLAEDANGYLWIGTDTTLIRWKDGVSSQFAPEGLRAASMIFGVTDLLPEADGRMWVGIARAGKGLGLEHVEGTHWSALKVPGLDTSDLVVKCIYKDRDGAMWIGTTDKGLYRIIGDRFDHYGASDGLSSDATVGIVEDSEGNIWVMTTEGLDRFRAFPVASYTMRQGLVGTLPSAVAVASDGALWAGSDGGIDVIGKGSIAHITERNGLPGKIVGTIFKDHLGQFWINVDDKLVIYHDGVYSPVNLPDGKPTGLLHSIAEDSAGVVWVIVVAPTTHTLYSIEGGKMHEEELRQSGLAMPYSVAAKADGGVWLGLINGDLASYKDGHLTMYPRPQFPGDPTPGAKKARPLLGIHTEAGGILFAGGQLGLMEKRGDTYRYLTEQNGLPCGRVLDYLRDNHDTFYVYMSCGIVSITAAEMERWWSDPASHVDFKFYGPAEGARTGVVYYSPALAKTPDGRLWFSGPKTLQVFDPARAAFNSLQPPVLIESIVDDGRTYVAGDGLRLAPNPRSVEFDYTALSYVAPNKVRFRYRLEGHDTDWQDAGTRRQAFYTDLPPGSYRFRVIAANNDGVWNEEGAKSEFYIAPAFYQREWFRILLAMLGLTSLWLFYVYRLRKSTELVRMRLTERLRERERIARDLHDSFFQGIQGLLLRFHTATTQLAPDEPTRPIFVSALEQSDQVMLEGRKLVLDLREPSEPMDLEGSLARLGEEFQHLHPAEFALTILGETRTLQPRSSEELYSLSREALYNAFRHAKATRIEAEIHYSPEYLTVRIRDNGRGIEESVQRDRRRAGHWGLPGMYERAENLGGTLTCWSGSGKGTELEVTIPAERAYMEKAKTVLELVKHWLRRDRAVTS